MGNKLSGPGRLRRRASAPQSPHAVSIEEALVACQAGDLFLLREHIVHAQLGVVLDKRMADDVTRFQQGAFPSTRVTHLPLWTGCGILLRRNGEELHALCVTDDGLCAVPFNTLCEQSKHKNDVLAIRRLQASCYEHSSSAFQQLAEELTSAAPVTWDSLTSLSTSPSPGGPGTPHQLPLVHTILRDATEILRSHTLGSPSPSSESFAQLSTAVVVAIYRHVGIIARSTSVAPHAALLTPSSLFSKTPSLSDRWTLSPADALSEEYRLHG